MFRPFKRLEAKWNAHTPKILHNRTKENLIFQLSLVAVMLLGYWVKDWWDERRRKEERAARTMENYIHQKK